MNHARVTIALMAVMLPVLMWCEETPRPEPRPQGDNSAVPHITDVANGLDQLRNKTISIDQFIQYLETQRGSLKNIDAYIKYCTSTMKIINDGIKIDANDVYLSQLKLKVKLVRVFTNNTEYIDALDEDAKTKVYIAILEASRPIYNDITKILIPNYVAVPPINDSTAVFGKNPDPPATNGGGAGRGDSRQQLLLRSFEDLLIPALDIMYKHVASQKNAVPLDRLKRLRYDYADDGKKLYGKIK